MILFDALCVHEFTQGSKFGKGKAVLAEFLPLSFQKRKCVLVAARWLYLYSKAMCTSLSLSYLSHV